MTSDPDVTALLGKVRFVIIKTPGMSSNPKLPFYYLNGSMDFPAPFLLQGARFNSFLYTVDSSKLQEVCDHWFNIPSGGEVYYQPLLPVVLVTFADYKRSGPDVKPYKEWGYVAYREVIFSIFVVRLKKENDVWLADHVGALVPYIFVDNPLVMAAGREVYGMPKMMANIHLPEKTDAVTPEYRIEALSTTHLNPNQPFHTIPLAGIKQKEGNPHEEASHRWRDRQTAFEELKKLIFGGDHITLPDLNLLIEIGEVFGEQKLPFSSLRQLRNINSSHTAAYQSIIDFYARMVHFEGAGLLPGTYSIDLFPNALYPFGEDLGLQSGQVADAAFWIEWDFIFEKGTDVWSIQPRVTFWQWLHRATQGLLKV